MITGEVCCPLQLLRATSKTRGTQLDRAAAGACAYIATPLFLAQDMRMQWFAVHHFDKADARELIMGEPL